MWADWTWPQQQHTSRDKSFQALSSLFVLQATKAGCRGLGTRLPATVCATSAHNYHSFLFFVFHSAICVIPTLGSTWISGSLPTSDHYHLIIKDLFTDWYVVSNTGKLPVNGGLNGHTLCLHRPLCLHCALSCPFQSTCGFTVLAQPPRPPRPWPDQFFSTFNFLCMHKCMWHFELWTCRRVHDIMALSERVTVIYPIVFAKPHQPVSFELDLNIDHIR